MLMSAQKRKSNARFIRLYIIRLYKLAAKVVIFSELSKFFVMFFGTIYPPPLVAGNQRVMSVYFFEICFWECCRFVSLQFLKNNLLKIWKFADFFVYLHSILAA